MPLYAYDRSGNIVATLDHLVIEDEDGVARLVDFEATEESGTRLRELWEVSGASGSTTWPEHLGERAPEFRVELDARQPLRCRRVVHRRSGVVRDRQGIADRLGAAQDEQLRAGARRVDVRGALGEPGRPIALDADGRDRSDREPDAEGRPRFVRHRGRDRSG